MLCSGLGSTSPTHDSDQVPTRNFTFGGTVLQASPHPMSRGDEQHGLSEEQCRFQVAGGAIPVADSEVNQDAKLKFQIERGAALYAESFCPEHMNL